MTREGIGEYMTREGIGEYMTREGTDYEDQWGTLTSGTVFRVSDKSYYLIMAWVIYLQFSTELIKFNRTVRNY